MAKSYKISDLFITAWEDNNGPTLTTEQMARVIDLRYSLDTAKESKDYVKVGFYSIEMLKILRKSKSVVAKINEEQVVDCINDINFFRGPWYFFPKVSEGIFQAPDEYMHDRNFEQLCYADGSFTKFLIQEKQKDPAAVEALNEMIAVLYTAPEDFRVEDIAERAKLVNALKDHEKAIVLHSFVNVREFIVERCPNLFPKPPESVDPKQEKLEITIVHTGPMWRKLLFNFAETDAFRGFQNARTAKIYEALDYLEQKIGDSIELKNKTHA